MADRTRDPSREYIGSACGATFGRTPGLGYLAAAPGDACLTRHAIARRRQAILLLFVVSCISATARTPRV